MDLLLIVNHTAVYSCGYGMQAITAILTESRDASERIALELLENHHCESRERISHLCYHVSEDA